MTVHPRIMLDRHVGVSGILSVADQLRELAGYLEDGWQARKESPLDERLQLRGEQYGRAEILRAVADFLDAEAVS